VRVWGPVGVTCPLRCLLPEANTLPMSSADPSQSLRCDVNFVACLHPAGQRDPSKLHKNDPRRYRGRHKTQSAKHKRVGQGAKAGPARE
jgi:hypothetical protein